MIFLPRTDAVIDFEDEFTFGIRYELRTKDGVVLHSDSSRVNSLNRDLLDSGAISIPTPGEYELAVFGVRDTSPSYSFQIRDIPNFTKQIVDVLAPSVTEIEAADMDSDGDVDLVAALHEHNELRWYSYDEAANRFSTDVLRHRIEHPVALSLADFNSDSHVDIVIASESTNELRWLEGTGEGFGQLHVIDAASRGVNKTVTIDIDHDDDWDILVSEFDDNQLVLWLNDGLGNFESRVIASGFSDPVGLSVDDIDADGDLDIVAASGVHTYWWDHDGDLSFAQHEIGNRTNSLRD